MKKRFVGKRKWKTKGLKVFAFLFLVFAFFLITFQFVGKQFQSKITNEEMFDYLFHDGMGKNRFFEFLSMEPTEFLLSNTMGIKIPKSESAFSEEVIGPTYEYVPDPSPNSDAKDPIIYLYNTHQTEGYSKNGISEYDITPTVLFGSYYFREKLNDLGLPTIVETNEISEILRMNNWTYSSSYKASRYLMEDAKKKHIKIEYFLDIHRDSAPYQSTMTESNGKKYAKVLFVIGKEHPNYQQNLDFANIINEKMKLKINTISRGVIGKEGPNVNGIYNQDISPKAILIEVGGEYNNIVEVTNTMEVLANVLKEYVEEHS